jgi:hypothetical protein
MRNNDDGMPPQWLTNALASGGKPEAFIGCMSEDRLVRFAPEDRPDHKEYVLAWLIEGYGAEWRMVIYRDGWYITEYGDRFHAVGDPEASDTAPAAVSHWMSLRPPPGQDD